MERLREFGSRLLGQGFAMWVDHINVYRRAHGRLVASIDGAGEGVMLSQMTDDHVLLRWSAPAGSVFPSHRHPFTQLLVAESGHCTFFTGGSEDQPLELRGDSTLHFPAGLTHHGSCKSDAVFLVLWGVPAMLAVRNKGDRVRLET